MPRYVSRILRSPARDELMLVPASMVESAAASELVPVERRAAEDLASAARDGGLWVVAGNRFARVLNAARFLAGGHEPVPERDASLLFDGGIARALVHDELDPVDLMVPVSGWEASHSFYFHGDSAFFKQVPMVRKLNHRLEVERGQLDDEARKAARRSVLEGQRCGVLRNELGGVSIVPDGEVVVDVRAIYGERFRFIIDGLRELTAAADALRDYAEQFRDAADAGWVLERPIDNSFVYAVNRRRLRTMLPLPVAGALVPVASGHEIGSEVAASAVVPTADGASEPAQGDPAQGDPAQGDPAQGEPVHGEPVHGEPVHGEPDGNARGDVDGDVADTGALVPERSSLLTEGVLVPDRRPARLGAAVPALLVSPELLDRQPLALAAGPAPRPVGQALIEHFASQLLRSAPDLGGPARSTEGSGIPVLRATTFRRPRGRLMRSDSPSQLVLAVVDIGVGGVRVLHGALTPDTSQMLAATIEQEGSLYGTFGLCRGAFGHVLAEVGSPMRAVQSMTSSVSYAHLLDGVTRLEDAAVRLQRVASELQRLADEGWSLTQPITGFWLRLRPSSRVPI